jgi:putative transposase
MDKWAYERGIELDFSRPGKPTDNAMVESFNGRLRQECLNEHWFMSLQNVRNKIEAWRGFYNEERPHSALDWKTPKEFALKNGSKPCLQNNKEPDLLTSEWRGNWVRVRANLNVLPSCSWASIKSIDQT